VSTGDGYLTRDVLRKHGAALAATELEGARVFWWACKKGHVGVVEVLLAFGADAENTLNPDGFTPLHAVASGGHTEGGGEVAEMLIAAGAQVSAPARHDKDFPGQTPLQIAGRYGNLGVAKVLLEHGADVNENGGDEDYPGDTTFAQAAMAGHYEVAELLLHRGVSARVVNPDTGNSLLHEAASGPLSGGRFLRVAELLLRNGALVSRQNKEGLTALHIASRRGRSDIAEVLLEHGARVNRRTRLGETPLHFAAKEGHLKTTEVLLEYDGSIDAKDSEGKTPIDWARDRGHYPVINALKTAEDQKLSSRLSRAWAGCTCFGPTPTKATRNRRGNRRA